MRISREEARRMLGDLRAMSSEEKSKIIDQSLRDIRREGGVSTKSSK